MMTLFTSDYLEYYLTLVGWIVSNGIWQVLEASGLFVLPFISIILQEWLKARAEGADEGNKGALSAIRVENRIWVAIVVILFAGVPFIDINLASIKYDSSRSEQCQVLVAKPEETNWSNAFTSLNNQTAKVPLWWFLIHSVSKGITSSAVASIPCGIDLRQMRIDIDNTRINDPLLAQEIADFTHDCYGPARAKLFMNRPILTDKQMSDVNWIGSHYFLDNAGFYDTYRSHTPRTAWPYNATRDAGLAQTNDGGGYPSCTTWWSDSSKGLRAKIIKQVEPDLLSRFARWLHLKSRDEVTDEVVRAIASPRQQTMNQGSVYTDYGGVVGGNMDNRVVGALGDIGLAVGSLSYFPSMDVLRQALPLVLSFLKMALVICIPLVLLIGLYDLKTVVTISCVEFALFFVDFWFQLARWIDSTILDALYSWDSPHSNWNPFLGIDNAMGDMLLNFVMGAMFIVLPAFWLSALSWVGVRAGSFAQMLINSSDGAKSAGGKGAGTLMKVGKMIVTKGKSK